MLQIYLATDTVIISMNILASALNVGKYKEHQENKD